MNIESPLEYTAEEEQVTSPPMQKVKRLTAARKKKYKQARWSRANNQSLNTTLPELLQAATPMYPNATAQATSTMTSPFQHRSLQYETFQQQDRLASQNMMVGGN